MPSGGYANDPKNLWTRSLKIPMCVYHPIVFDRHAAPPRTSGRNRKTNAESCDSDFGDHENTLTSMENLRNTVESDRVW